MQIVVIHPLADQLASSIITCYIVGLVKHGRAVADPGGFPQFPWKPPFGLAMYTVPVFYADDYYMWKPPLPAKLI